MNHNIEYNKRKILEIYRTPRSRQTAGAPDPAEELELFYF